MTNKPWIADTRLPAAGHAGKSHTLVGEAKDDGYSQTFVTRNAALQGRLKTSQLLTQVSKYMVIALSIFSKFCFGWTLVYLIFSLLSALKVGRRHYQPLIFLEFQPRRARGAWEAARAKLMVRLGLCTIFLVPVGIASSIASMFIS